MLNKLKHTAKETLIYSLGNISTKLIGLILLPLYTSHLTTEEYGIFAILEVTSQLLTVALGFRLSTAMLRFSSSEESEEKKKTVIFIALVSTFFSVILLNLIFQPFSKELSVLFFDHDQFKSYFKILFLWSSFDIFNRLFFDYLRLKNRSVFYMIVTILKVSIILVFNIYFIAYLNLGIKGIIISQLIGCIFVFIIILPKIFRSLSYKFDFSVFKEMFKYGFPLIFSGISMLLLAIGDRYILKYYLSYSEVGVYSLGYKIAGLINMLLIQSFQLGFLPIAFKMYSKPDAKRYFSKVLTYYTFILIFVSLGLVFFSKEIILLLSKKQSYVVAYTVVPIITLAFIFKGMQYVFSIGLHYAKKTQYNAYIISILVVVNMGINIVLIPQIGMYGSAVAAVISNLSMMLLFYHYSQKLYHIPFEIKKIYKLFAVGFALYGISTLSNYFNLYIGMIIKFIMLLSFPFILYLLKFYEPIEIVSIQNFYRKWRNPKSWKKNLSSK